MPRPSKFLRHIHAAAVCLLALAATVGPVGLGAALSGAGCRVDCCDDAPQVPRYARYTKNVSPTGCCPHQEKQASAQASGGVEHAGVEHAAYQTDEHSLGGHSDEHSGEHSCPDDCPSCNAGVSVALAMTSLALPRMLVFTSEVAFADVGEVPPATTADGIYRPPRTLA